MKYIVKYGGWIVYEGNSLKKAEEVCRACGLHGTIWEEGRWQPLSN